jgi:hypothetical protein
MRLTYITHIGVATAIALFSLLLPLRADAWTSAKLAGVDVALAVAPRGPSQVTTQARFEIQGGKFHGFTLAPIPGAELVATECRAVSDDGRILPLTYSPLADGRVRVLFDAGVSLEYGAVTYTLVHRIDLVAAGALRRHDGRARLDWTPLVWDAATDAMTVDVLLPGESAASPPAAVPSVTEDYEIAPSAAGMRLTKVRTVRWYSMRVAVDFDAELVPGLRADRGQDTRETAAAIAAPAPAPAISKRPPAPLFAALAPVLAALVGFAVMLRKATRTRRWFCDLGLPAKFLLLDSASLPVRFALSAFALALGLAAQRAGSIAAGIPALAVAVSLWTLRRYRGAVAVRPGGAWRAMSEEDVARYQRLCRSYGKRRTGLIDVTTPLGAFAFALSLATLGAIFRATYEDWPRLALAALLDGAVWFVPAWFSQNRNELPVDPTLESFIALKRWRKALDRLVGARLHGAAASFYVREDDGGPIEVRLRVGQPLPTGVHEIEVANELVRHGQSLRRRCAVVLRLEPGSEISRRLAACPNAAEHHLTPDLKDEVLVLRNRRGQASEGLAPLRAALARIAG